MCAGMRPPTGQDILSGEHRPQQEGPEPTRMAHKSRHGESQSRNRQGRDGSREGNAMRRGAGVVSPVSVREAGKALGCGSQEAHKKRDSEREQPKRTDTLLLLLGSKPTDTRNRSPRERDRQRRARSKGARSSKSDGEGGDNNRKQRGIRRPRGR